MTVKENATGAVEDVEEEGEEASGLGAIEIDVLGLTVADKDGDEDIEEEEGVAPGVGTVEINAVGVTVGAVEMYSVGVEATGEDGAPLTEGADVTDILGVAPLNVTFLTTP